MQIKEILNYLIKFNKEQLNEMAITRKNSGKPFFEGPKSLEEVINRCVELYHNNPNSIGHNDILNLKLQGEFPLNKSKLDNPVTVVYGNDSLGVKHILARRGEEFENKSIGERLSEDEVIEALKNLDKAIKSSNRLVDFDLKGINPKPSYKISKNRPAMPYGDRVILVYEELFYVILVAKYDGVSDVTCPLTIFKPSQIYRRRIEGLNKENNYI